MDVSLTTRVGNVLAVGPAHSKTFDILSNNIRGAQWFYR